MNKKNVPFPTTCHSFKLLGDITSPKNCVYLVKRSESQIFKGQLSAVASCKKFQPAGPAAAEIFPALYNSPAVSGSVEDRAAEENHEEDDCPETVIFNPQIDGSQLKAVESCDAGKRITIIHGPPGYS